MIISHSSVPSVNWNSIGWVYALARKAQVDFAIHYNDCDNSWYCTVSSAAPSEEFIGKNHSFDVAIECVGKHLSKLLGRPYEVPCAFRG